MIEYARFAPTEPYPFDTPERWGRRTLREGAAVINLTYPALLDLFPQHLAPKRTESASFLIWYLENYYRLDALEAIDSVCDQSGDKGVDGIFVNDNDSTITVFQSKISQSATTTIGDASLREFAGTLTQFETQESIHNLAVSAGTAHVAALIKRLDLVNKRATHELRGEFLSNVDIDNNGLMFLQTCPQISFNGKARLESTYISDARDIPTHAAVTFDIVGFDVTQYIVDAKTKAVIAPVKATELVRLHGISDQSLYAYNVRGPLGRTQVNKDIVASIKNTAVHKIFPLFHNGITVICGQLGTTKEGVTISDYWVVNGCQSLTAFYDNSGRLTEDLRVLAKFIQMEPGSAWAEKVTHYSNNQNGVKARDFMSNNTGQIRLQNEFRRDYPGEYAYEIKRGEVNDPGTPLSNETIGLYLMAFDLKEPWATHRKYQVFEDRHADLFARPEVTADRIVLCQVIVETIETAVPRINNKLCARYVLTKYFLLYAVRQILENDDLANEILTQPRVFVRQTIDRNRFRECIQELVNDIVIDLNAEIDEYGDDFDYRDKMRDAAWVKDLSKKIVGDHQKLVNRGRIKSFSETWRE